jgi:hypothetical protein
VGAGDRDALLEPHQLGEHLGAPDDGTAPQAGGRQLRVVAPDRSGDDDHRGVADLRRVMADEHARATFAQALDIGVVARVRALHLVTDIDQHLGDAGHADAADADEMNGAELARQFHLHSFPRSLSRARHKPICRFGQMGALRRGRDSTKRRIGLPRGYFRNDASGRSFGIPFAFCDFSRLCREEKFPAPAVFRQRDYSAPNGQYDLRQNKITFIYCILCVQDLCVSPSRVETRASSSAVSRLDKGSFVALPRHNCQRFSNHSVPPGLLRKSG